MVDHRSRPSPSKGSIHIAGNNYGINITGDGNVVLDFGGLRQDIASPTDLSGVRRMLFRTSAQAVSINSVIGWLSPDADIIPVRPRAVVEEELLPWVVSQSSPMMRLMVGPGGQGKTVAGRLLCDAAAQHGWLTGFGYMPQYDWRSPTAENAAILLDNGVPAMRRWAEVIAALCALPSLEEAGIEARALLVVDYAENQLEPISQLLYSLTAHPSAGKLLTRVRVLLLARYAGPWWEELAVHHPGHAWVEPQGLCIVG